ncbi:MAG: cell division protein FtsA [Alphaproteobacteria bacterium]|jgi:cell division protein FtsA|nr:cell division protein FtsA [Alphaproteobacteria bacterium]MBT5389996.1 cell division protein FtsA [Alphaproteobacteria bacterium]
MKKTFSKNDLITALDIGTTKICCAIARVEEDNTLKVIGLGNQLSKGLKNGFIVDMEAAVNATLNAVQNAEEMAKETIHDVFVSISGKVASQIIDVDTPITSHEISDSDIQKVLSQSQQAISSTREKKIIHAFPIGYTIDGNRGIRDPRGMYGERLGVSLHVISSPTGLIRNLSTCIEHCHLDVCDFVSSAYASGLAILVEDERDLGVTVLDLGGGSTNIASFMGGHCVYIDNIPIGGIHITNDIAQGLSTPVIQAERLKTLYGSAISTPKDEKETIVVPQIGEDHPTQATQISKATLNKIIRPRLEEILEIVKNHLDQNKLAKAASRRVVITGGGSQIAGIKELASLILDRQVRLGKPLHIQGLSETASGPSFATSAGLLSFALQSRSYYLSEGKMSMGVVERLQAWIQKYF